MRLAKKIALGLAALLALLAVAAFIFLSPYSPYQYGRYIPRDLDDAHRYIIEHLSPDFITQIKAMKSEKEMGQFHMGAGMGMRNSWALWSGSRLSRYFNSIGIHHPDDMTGIILETLWCKIHDQPFQLEKKVQFYQDYWNRMNVPEGLTTTTGEPLEFYSSWNLGTDEKPRNIHFATAQDGTKWTWEYGGTVAPLSPEIQNLIDQREKEFKANQQGQAEEPPSSPATAPTKP